MPLKRRDKRCYEEEQEPFLKRILPQMIAEFSTELQQLKDQQWEKTSFERAVKILSQVEQKWDEFNGKGLKALFRTNFFYKFNACFFEPLLNKLMSQADAFKMMMSNSRAQQEKQTLTALLDKYQPEHGQQEGIRTEEKTKALAFLIFVREEYMNE